MDFVGAREFINHSAVWPPIMLPLGIPPIVETFYYEECAVYFWFGGFEWKIDFFEWLRTFAILDVAVCFLIVM